MREIRVDPGNRCRRAQFFLTKPQNSLDRSFSCSRRIFTPLQGWLMGRCYFEENVTPVFFWIPRGNCDDTTSAGVRNHLRSRREVIHHYPFTTCAFTANIARRGVEVNKRCSDRAPAGTFAHRSGAGGFIGGPLVGRAACKIRRSAVLTGAARACKALRGPHTKPDRFGDKPAQAEPFFKPAFSRPAKRARSGPSVSSKRDILPWFRSRQSTLSRVRLRRTFSGSEMASRKIDGSGMQSIP